jgi:hypothetical protein
MILSDRLHAFRFLHTCGLATRVLTLPLMGLPPIEHICLFWTYTEAPSLCRSYPASSVLRTSPPPHTARPVSRELPVDPYRDHRWGFPCCIWSPMRTCHRHYPGRFNGACSLVYLHCQRPSPCNSKVGSCNYFFGRVEDWRAGVGRSLCSLLLALSVMRVSQHLDLATYPAPATSNAACGFPRTALSCSFLATGYGTGTARVALGTKYWTLYSLNSPRVSYSHCLLHRPQPYPGRFRACITWRRTFLATQSLM